MESDPDHGWKPKNRPQSTIAQNFMTELDSLFKLDGDLDSLDRNVHQKKQAVSSQTQELEALEARLRAAEERLNEAKSNSPPRRNDGKRRTPIQGVFPDQDKARLNGSSSPLGQTSAQPAANIAERPSAAQPFESDKA